MKGFMTVRKWIDRSIAGLETRSGDYPIVNTKNVAIIVMLSGLENIPRITELKEIRSQSKPKKRVDPEGSSEGLTEKDQKNIRDDMITLPVRRARADDTGRRTPARDVPKGYDTFVPAREPVPQKEVPAEAEEQAPPVAFEVPRQAPPRRSVPVPEPVSEGEDSRIPEALAPSRRRVIVAHAEKDHAHHPSSHTLSAHGSQRTGHKTGISDRSSRRHRSGIPMRRSPAPRRQNDRESRGSYAGSGRLRWAETPRKSLRTLKKAIMLPRKHMSYTEVLIRTGRLQKTRPRCKAMNPVRCPERSGQ